MGIYAERRIYPLQFVTGRANILGMKKLRNVQYVHNLNEVRALVKESYARGMEEAFDGATWIAHTGGEICKTAIRFTEFDLVMPDRSSLTVEVL